MIDRKVILTNKCNERLTWEQIKEKYPYQFVGLTDVEQGNDYDDIISATVKYTSKDTSFDKLLKLQENKEIFIIHTGKDVEEVDGVLYRYRQGEDYKSDIEDVNKSSERLTWKQIAEKYPLQNVGLVDVEFETDSVSVKSAIVKYTSKDISYEELCMRAIAREILLRYTTPDIIEMNGKYYKAVVTDSSEYTE